MNQTFWEREQENCLERTSDKDNEDPLMIQTELLLIAAIGLCTGIMLIIIVSHKTL